MKTAYNTLGIAYISKNMVLGQDDVVNSIRKNKVALVIISNDSSDNTKKKLWDKCKYYNIKIIEVNDEGQLAKSIGKKKIKVMGIKNKKLADKIYEQIKGEINGES